MAEQYGFQVHENDNVATALTEIEEGIVTLYGAWNREKIEAIAKIPRGHKIALTDLKEGDPVIKYGVVIGACTSPVKKGSWVHLHVMRSLYDTRSGHLDLMTGAPTDMKYE